jgi:hypothetical protein
MAQADQPQTQGESALVVAPHEPVDFEAHGQPMGRRPGQACGGHELGQRPGTLFERPEDRYRFVQHTNAA